MLAAATGKKMVADAVGFLQVALGSCAEENESRFLEIPQNGDTAEEEDTSTILLQIWAWIKERKVISILCCHLRWRRSNRWTDGGKEIDKGIFVFSS